MNDDEALVPRLMAALREAPTDSAAYGVDRDRLRARLGVSVGTLAASHPRTISKLEPAPGAGIGPIGHGAVAGFGKAWLVSGLVAGVIAGAAADYVYSARTDAPKKAQSSVVSEPLPREVPAPTATARTDGSGVIPPSSAPSSSATSASSAQVLPRDRGDTLAAEQRLLDAARTALSSANPEAALGPLRRHASRFPNGELAEEREALWVRVLVAAGHDDDARVHAAAFHRQFPSSLFAPVVDRAFATISRRNDGGAPKP